MNDVLLINQDEVVKLLPMKDCIAAMRATLRALAEGKTLLPLRTVQFLPEGRGAFASMPAVVLDPYAIGLKVITVFPKNHGTAYDSHQGAVLLFEPEHGSLVAIMDASTITAIRTAAVTAVATDALARQDARTLGIMGSGVQAATHLESIRLVRPLEHVLVWSRSAEHARAFAERESRKHGIPVTAASSAEQVVRESDIVCTTTSSREPVLQGTWLTAGTHVNAIGSSTRVARELDTEAVRCSRLYVDRRESTLNEAGEYLMAAAEGAVDERHIAGEVGEVLTGKVKGRGSAEEITLFKSLGLAIEDVASAHLIYNAAKDRADLPRFRLGGLREQADLVPHS
jgi:ornithine cyclodeaminase